MIEFLASVREREETLAGTSPASQRQREQVERIAHAPHTTVLLLGKALQNFEGIARAIHARSPHSQHQGVYGSVHAAAIGTRPEADGAGGLRELLNRCRGGTLFLRGVHELESDVQAQLLEHLNANAAGPGTSSSAAPEAHGAAPRVLASTSMDLERSVEAGSFRPDLFYRLNVLAIRLPSLRDRVGDLGTLARAVLRRLRIRMGTACSLAPEAEEMLAAHPWPGDLFELEAVLTQAALWAHGAAIRPEHLKLVPPRERTGQRGERSSESLIPFPAASRSLRDSEEALIRRVLAEETGNRSSAARVLGINRTTLYNKLRQYGIA